MIELAKRGTEKFRKFQTIRKENQAKSDIPTGKNFFKLLERLKHTDRPGVPTEFVVQNGDYYVNAQCLLYWDGRAWVTDRLLTIVQPTKIEDMDLITRFSLRKKDINPDESKIIVATALIDKLGSKKYILASTTDFSVIDNSVQSPADKKASFNQLPKPEYKKTIDNAYRIAGQAINRRSLPTGLDVVDPGIIQLKLQPQLI